MKLTLGGYAGSLIRFIVDKEYLDKDKYHLFASQFQLHSDINGSWKGEYWGKFLRGACECYKATLNPNVYKNIEESVFEMISYMENDGTLSSCPDTSRLTGWDMWSRKYAMVGMVAYVSICKYKSKKKKVIAALKKQANSIISNIGRNKKGILETSNIYGSLNSASILGVFVDLYSLTNIKKYLSFAKYIISTGLCEGENIIKSALKNNAYPYQWTSPKAYEMTACFQGLLHYALVTNDKKYLSAVISYVNKVKESDFTIIGGLGTESEFFNHSSLTQTEVPEKIGLETCVTVSFMGLCNDLYNATKDPFYISLLETMSFNCLFGAVNDQDQSMNLAEGRVWHEDGYDTPPHEVFYFDSYTPLVSDRRAKVIGGFQLLQGDRSYGCCLANGGYGLGLVHEFAVSKDNDGYLINLYNDFHLNDVIDNKNVRLCFKGSVYGNGKMSLKVKANGQSFAIKFRIPDYGTPSIYLNGNKTQIEIENGYFSITKNWESDIIKIEFDFPIVSHHLNGKIAFTRGPIVLARDSRLGEVDKPLETSNKGKLIKNDIFKSNETILLDNGDEVVDFSSAGKNMDDPNSRISVWMNENKGGLETSKK